MYISIMKNNNNNNKVMAIVINYINTHTHTYIYIQAKNALFKLEVGRWWISLKGKRRLCSSLLSKPRMRAARRKLRLVAARAFMAA